MEFKDINLEMPTNDTAIEALELFTEMMRTMRAGFRTMETIVGRLNRVSFNQYGIYVSDVNEYKQEPGSGVPDEGVQYDPNCGVDYDEDLNASQSAEPAN